MGASTSAAATPTSTAGARAAKVDAILDAATEQFSRRGYAKTSMAAIAVAAGVSRPALYQFFSNREDIFRSVLTRILRDRNAAALAALESDAPLNEQLDGFLQRRFGDIMELLASMPHGTELIDAHLSVAPDIGKAADDELRLGLEAFLSGDHPKGAAAQATELLQLGPLGMKSDHPPLGVYRTRLSTLAAAAAALLEAS